MKAYFTNLLTSAWATKSEYFVLVGFLFGVVVTCFFSAPDVWSFFIDLAAISAGIFTPLAVAAAIWVGVSQINHSRQTEEDKLKNEGKLAAAGILHSLAGFDVATDMIRSRINDILCSDGILWEFSSSGSIAVKAGLKDDFFNILSGLSRVVLEKVSSIDGAILFAREDSSVLEFCISFDLWVDNLKFNTSDKSDALQLNVRILNLMHGLIGFADSGARLLDWVNDNYGFESPRSKKIEGGSYSSDVWPKNEDLVLLAQHNSPISWGGNEARAKAAWVAAGNTTELPVRESTK